MSQYETYETYESEGPYETEWEGPYETEYESYETGFELNEVQEMELAAELLEITNEAELEEFLGGIVKAAGNFLKSPTGKALGGVLKDVAKTALPIVGGALGSFVAPGVGTAIGSKLGSMASNLFEVELEGVDREQAEFEIARRYVRFATAAARNASLAPPNLPPQVIANRAVTAAARRYAPGLVRGTTSRRRPRRRPQGYGAPAYGAPAYGAPAYGGYGTDVVEDGNGNGGGYDPRPRTGRWVR